ncbi:cell division protein FtsZ [Elusimicrobiota bacterium]
MANITLSKNPANIKIIGVGGGGSNAVNRMIDAGVQGVEFISINTDVQALRLSKAPVRIQIGEQISQGLGVGGNPNIGKQSAEESHDRIRGTLEGSQMVFVTAGMGGGTGTGAAPVIASIAKSLGILTVGVVTKPFDFEGAIRLQQAEDGIKNIRNYTDTLIIIPNQKVFQVIDSKTSITDAFKTVDDVLRQAVQSITDVINQTGEINVDFADVRTIMQGAGEALMGIGESTGPTRSLDAAQKAIRSPLLDDVSIDGAKGILINITGNNSTSMIEVNDAINLIRDAGSPKAHVFYGQVIDPKIGDKIKITVIATGFSGRRITNKLFAHPVSGKAEREVSSTDLNKPAYTHWTLKKLK